MIKIQSSRLILQLFLFFNTFILSKGDEDVVECPIVETVDPFDIEVYASLPWYVQQQAVVLFQPIENFYCVRAEYTILNPPTFPFGYTVDVMNYGEDVSGNPAIGDLCAYQTTEADSKLGVAPCFLPKSLAGPYWVVAYDEMEGYALISGGQPTIPSDPNDITAGCTSADGGGLWIFTREQIRNETLVQMVRGIAQDAGFDLSVLIDVEQDSCVEEPECADLEDEFDIGFGIKKDCEWVGRGFTNFKCNFLGDYCPATCGLCDDD